MTLKAIFTGKRNSAYALVVIMENEIKQPKNYRKADCCGNCKYKVRTREDYFLCQLYQIYTPAENVCEGYEREMDYGD